MDGGIVERVGTFGYSHKSGGLLKPEISHTGYFFYLFTTFKPSFLLPVFYDIAGYIPAQSRDVGKKRGACRIQIYSHFIDAAFNHIIQFFGKLHLVDVMLIKAYSDRLRINFYQFSQGVLYPSRDGDITTLCGIQIGEFLACNF